MRKMFFMEEDDLMLKHMEILQIMKMLGCKKNINYQNDT